MLLYFVLILSKNIKMKYYFIKDENKIPRPSQAWGFLIL